MAEGVTSAARGAADRGRQRRAGRRLGGRGRPLGPLRRPLQRVRRRSHRPPVRRGGHRPRRPRAGRRVRVRGHHPPGGPSGCAAGGGAGRGPVGPHGRAGAPDQRRRGPGQRLVRARGRAGSPLPAGQPRRGDQPFRRQLLRRPGRGVRQRGPGASPGRPPGRAGLAGGLVQRVAGHPAGRPGRRPSSPRAPPASCPPPGSPTCPARRSTSPSTWARTARTPSASCLASA
jgi:hypothetical protein